MNKSHPIVDSKCWNPCGSWSENLTSNTKQLTKDSNWKPGFNPFANKLPTYSLNFENANQFDFITHPNDPWGRPFVKSVFYFSHKPTKPQRIAMWRIDCPSGVSDYLKESYNNSRVYEKFRLIGFTSVNKEVVRLIINNITSDALDRIRHTNTFVEYKPANFIDKDVDDKRPVPMWIV